MKISGVTVRRRLYISLMIGTVLFVALMVRLGYVQLWMGSELAQRAEDSWRREVPFASRRGEILDRNGVKLTYNVSSPSVMAVPARSRIPRRRPGRSAEFCR